MYVDNEERNQNTSFSEKEIFPDKAALFDMRKIIGQAANDTRQQEEPKPDQEEPESYAALLARLEVDPTEKISKPPVCITIGEGNDTAIVGTLGNVSVLIGKAKSGKTFGVGVMVAALLNGQSLDKQIKGHLPEGRKLVLYFDTEQSRYHLQRSIKRICTLVGIGSPQNLKVYGLRSIPTEKRRDAIEWAIYNTPNVGFVVIDGIRDLVFDINSPEEATDTATRLLRWTDEKQIHILTVLHQNKGDQNARGHLGTELVNKAETVLSVTKDPNDKSLSTVGPEQCRDKDFEPFNFGIDENGIPYLADAPVSSRDNTGKGKPAPKPITTDEVDAIIRRAFANDETLQRGLLKTAIGEASEHVGKRLASNKADEFIVRATTDGYLVKEQPPKGYAVYRINPNKMPSN